MIEQWGNSFVRKDVLACRQGVVSLAVCMNLFLGNREGWILVGRYLRLLLATTLSRASESSRDSIGLALGLGSCYRGIWLPSFAGTGQRSEFYC